MEDCPNNCCGPFAGVQRGLESLEGLKFSEIFLVEEDIPRIIQAGHSHYIETLDGRDYKMKLRDDGSCLAFRDGRCSIHQIKPILCRAFPFYIDMFVGLCAVTVCPGFESGWTPLEDVMNEIESAKRMYAFWLGKINSLQEK